MRNVNQTKILVAGVGYVGSLLCEKLLHRGFQVRGVDNFDKITRDSLAYLCRYPNFEFQEKDVILKNDVENIVKDVDAIVWLAACVGAPSCNKKPYYSELVNLESVRNLCQLVNKRPIIFSSTDSCFGKNSQMVDETTTCHPISVYGKHKKLAEDILLQNPNTVVLRFATGCGLSLQQRLSLMVNDLTYQAVKRKEISVFQSQARRTFIDVADMGEAIIWSLENWNNLNYKLFCVGDDNNNITKADLARMIQKHTDCKLSFDDKRQDPDARNYIVSHARINNAGWKAQKSIEDTVKELIKAVPTMKIHSQYE